jgi:SagB-type dehydrogenase family enzyme
VRRAAPANILARLTGRAAIDAYANGEIVARFENYSVGVGVFGAGAADWLAKLRTGVPLGALAPEGRKTNKEINLLVSRLAGLGLLEYGLEDPRSGADLITIEPLLRDYRPHLSPLQNSDTLVLSRFAYMRRRGNEMVLESPRAGALFKILDPQLASLIATLSTPQRVKQLRQMDGFLGLASLALLVDCEIVLKIDVAGESNLALWDFHDLLFHTRSTSGRHTNPIGSVYPHVGAISPLPAVRPSWPGKKIDLRKFSTAAPEAISPFEQLLRNRHSIRSFDDSRPISLPELSRFLEMTARVLSRSDSKPGFDDGGLTVRPYPSAGASYELELYLAVNVCQGLPHGFYHYDAGANALVPIGAPQDDLEMLLAEAKNAMGATATPQILITIAARFGRVSWKYSTIAYSLIMKDVGLLTQTFYLAATDMGLGGCAIGIVNIDVFAKMTGVDFTVEGPVGQFALGRIARTGTSG